MKDAEKTAGELGVDISTDEGKLKSSIQEARIVQTKDVIANQPCLGSITKQRWESEDSRSGFPCLNGWKGGPTDIVADIKEIIQQLIPIHVYYSSKLGQNVNTTICRLCQTTPIWMPTPLPDGIPVSPQKCLEMLIFCVVATLWHL